MTPSPNLTPEPYELVATTDDAQQAYKILRECRARQPLRDFDLVEVRWMTRPVRTTHRWAVVRKKLTPEPLVPLEAEREGAA